MKREGISLLFVPPFSHRTKFFSPPPQKKSFRLDISLSLTLLWKSLGEEGGERNHAELNLA